MNADDAAGLAALTVIAVPLLIAMGASMKPERRHPPAAFARPPTQTASQHPLPRPE